MTGGKKIAQKRLTLLQVAERLRNVSEACRRHSVSRSQFYEYKRAFQEWGLDGLWEASGLEQPVACLVNSGYGFKAGFFKSKTSPRCSLDDRDRL